MALSSAHLSTSSEGEPLWGLPFFSIHFPKQRRETAFEFEIKTPFLKVTKHSGHLDLWLGPLYKVYTFVLLLFLLQRSLKGRELTIALPKVVFWGRGNLLLCTTLQRSLSLFTHDVLHNWNRTSNYFGRMLEWKRTFYDVFLPNCDQSMVIYLWL